jgi:radial spoke head protein 9
MPNLISIFKVAMNSEGLTLSIEYLASTGILLSTEQKAALQTSLVMLQNAQKFHEVHFWGKIVGIKESYFIASGVGKGNELQDRKFLYR